MGYFLETSPSDDELLLTQRPAIMPYPGPLLVLHDSGPPITTEGTPSTDYTTLVLVHGFAWHSGAP